MLFTVLLGDVSACYGNDVNVPANVSSLIVGMTAWVMLIQLLICVRACDGCMGYCTRCFVAVQME